MGQVLLSCLSRPSSAPSEAGLKHHLLLPSIPYNIACCLLENSQAGSASPQCLQPSTSSEQSLQRSEDLSAVQIVTGVLAALGGFTLLHWIGFSLIVKVCPADCSLHASK